jgi:hypothetical protein
MRPSWLREVISSFWKTFRRWYCTVGARAGGLARGRELSTGAIGERLGSVERRSEPYASPLRASDEQVADLPPRW